MTNWVDFKIQNPDMEDFFLRKFNSEEQFTNELNNYQANYFQKLYHRSSVLFKNNDQLLQKFKYTDLTLLCKHGDKCRSKNETSKNSHTYRMQCPFIAKLKYDNKQNCLIFSAYNLEHNHPISKEIYESYTIVKTAKLKQNNEAIKLQKNLDSAKATVYNQTHAINSEFDYNLLPKDIHNFKKSQNINKHKSQADQLWDEIQKMHETDSQSVKIRLNHNNELECIFIQTSFMRQWYIDFGDIHHIDSTFKVNVENFQLYISLTVNQHFRGVPTAYCFMKSASSENLEFFYQNVSGKKFVDGELIIFNEQLATVKPIVNIIDKDLTNIELLKKYYPDSAMLLCTFHVIKWFKTLCVNELDGKKEEKEVSLVILKQMVYAKSQAEVDDNFNQLKQVRGTK